MTASYYSKSAGCRVAVAQANIHQLRNAAKNHHAADPNHADLPGMIAEIDKRDAVYYPANPQDTKPVYPWEGIKKEG